MNLNKIYRYPVKSFAAEALQQARATPDGGIDGDRIFALSQADVDPQSDDIFETKSAFVRIARHPAMVHYSATLTAGGVRLNSFGGQVLDLVPDVEPNPADQAKLRQWFDLGEIWRPWLVRRNKGGYWDAAHTPISIINLATIRELEKISGRKLNPLRFRGNLYIDGLKAWQEHELVGGALEIGDVSFRVVEPIVRCRATSIDPETKQEDINIPQLLYQNFQHRNCGIHVQAMNEGEIAIGNSILTDSVQQKTQVAF